MQENLNQKDARQGERGRPVLWVLVASLALLAVATVALLTWNGAKSPNDYASQSQDAARREATGSIGGSTTAPSPANPANPPPAQPSASGDSKPK